jgi:phosphate transport system protein
MERIFEKELRDLKGELLEMAGCAVMIVQKSISALKERDLDLAEEIFQDDKRIDQMEMDIERRSIDLIARRGPVAKDLRLIIGVIKINNDLERIGDHAVNIAQAVKILSTQPLLKPLIDIPRMAELSMKMLRDSLDSFLNEDSRQAKGVCESDDEVDSLADQILRELLTYMMEDPRAVSRAIQLMLVSRNLERIADLATNIAEEAIYIAEARVIKHHAEERKDLIP